MSSIFISHSSRDGAVAAQIRDRLVAQGHSSVFLDFDPEDGIPAGRSWEQELYARLKACRAVVVLCSEHSMASDWVFAEITHAKALGKHVFPLRVAPCEIRSLLSDVQVVDLTRDPEEGYERLWRGLRLAGLDPKDAFHWDGSRPPYPGLLAFQEEDAAIFFGRAAEIGEGLGLLQRLRRFGGTGWLLVLGASGSGKSSLVRAGLLPRLRRDRDSWRVVGPFRPLEQPFDELSQALARSFSEAGDERSASSILSALRPSPSVARARTQSFLVTGLVIAAIIALRQGVSVSQLIFQVALPVFCLTQLARLVTPWLRRQGRADQARKLKAEIDEYGGGFYGVMAFLTFLHMEYQDLEALWRRSGGAWDFFTSFSFEWVFSFGVDSLLNGLKALIWPLHWYGELGRNALWVALFAWLIYRVTLVMAKPWLPVMADSDAVEEGPSPSPRPEASHEMSTRTEE